MWELTVISSQDVLVSYNKGENVPKSNTTKLATAFKVIQIQTVATVKSVQLTEYQTNRLAKTMQQIKLERWSNKGDRKLNLSRHNWSFDTIITFKTRK